MISHNIRLPLEEMLIVVREHLDDAARPWRQRGGELGAGFECTRVALADLPNTKPSDWQVQKNAEEARDRTNRLRMSAIHLRTAAAVAEMAVEEAERVTQELERFVARPSGRQVITTPFPTLSQVARDLGLSKAAVRQIDKLVKDTMKPTTKRARKKDALGRLDDLAREARGYGITVREGECVKQARAVKLATKRARRKA